MALWHVLPRRRRPARVRSLHVDSDLPDPDLARVARAIEELLGRREPTSRRVAAAEILHAYERLGADGRRRFLSMLGERFGIDPTELDRAMVAVRTAEDPTDLFGAVRRLRRAVTPRIARLLRDVTMLPGGVKVLVDLRADLLEVPNRDEPLMLLDDVLAEQLSTLFDVGLLRLERIRWDISPAALLEKLIAYEAVHEISGWDDLKYRLERDRRCYALFHPAMPDEPLVFVEIALTKGLANAVEHVLTDPHEDETDADTATFYSITSCQAGLAGVNLGNELIKRVVEELRAELPHVKHFATLSPIPSFRRWVLARLEDGEVTNGERDVLGDLAEVRRRVSDVSALDDPSLLERWRPALLSLCARYLTSTRDDGRALDPVANFHLSNGASVERLNWLANPGRGGIAESLGIMVNYRYDLASIAPNADAYVARGAVAASTRVTGLRK